MSIDRTEPSRILAKALPDNVQIFEATAREVAEALHDDVYEYSRRHEFRLAHMNTSIREQMFDAMIQDLGIIGGWCYWYCMPGCLPDSNIIGPFPSYHDAIDAAIADASDMEVFQ